MPEIWLYNGETFKIYQLQNQRYIERDHSLAFPNLPIPEIYQFLQQADTVDYLELVKEFRR